MPSKERSLLNCNFAVKSGALAFRASKVKNIERTLELEEVREGGVNGYVHALVKPSSQLKRLEFERGFCAGEDAKQLVSLQGKRQSQPMTISIFDRDGSTLLKTYRVEGWTVVKLSLSELDAKDGGLLLEQVELVYETLTDGDK